MLEVAVVLAVLWVHVVGSFMVGSAAKSGGRSALEWFGGSLIATPLLAGLALVITILGAHSAPDARDTP